MYKGTSDNDGASVRETNERVNPVNRLETRVEMLWEREREAREREFDHPEDV
jgi:hypothetical protein